MSKYFRIFSLLLALCLGLCGCGVIVLPKDDVTTAPVTSVSPETTEAPVSLTTAPIYTAPERPDAQAAADAALAALPDLHFDGETLLIVTANEVSMSPLFPTNGETGENRARLARNLAVTERHGIGFIPSNAGIDAIYTDTLAAQNANLYYADLLVLPAEQVGRFTAAGLLRNLRNLPFWTTEPNSAAIAGKAAYNHTHIHSIDGRAGCGGKTRQGADNNNILGIVKTGDTFPKNGIEFSGKRAGNLVGRGCIAVDSQTGKLLDNSQFLDISGDGGLGYPEAFLLKECQQLLLGLNITVGDDLHNFCLSLALHSSSPLLFINFALTTS